MSISSRIRSTFDARLRPALGVGMAVVLIAALSPLAINSAEANKHRRLTPPYLVGDTGPGGGIVFIVPTSRLGVGGDSYFEVAPMGWNGGRVDPALPWATAYAGCGNSLASCLINSIYTGDDVANAVSRNASRAIGMGLTNTNTIVGKHGGLNAGNILLYAAGLARKHTVTTGSGTYDDWFLPSKNELNELCKYARGQATGNLDNTCSSDGRLKRGFAADAYWSSSEFDQYFARAQNFRTGILLDSGSKGTGLSVRPIRSFIIISP